MGGRTERGSVVAELAIALPVLILMAVGGLILGYMAYGRAALALTANVAARELAASFDPAKLDNGVAYRYEGFVETFGLPRSRVRAIALRQDVGQAGWGDTTESVVLVAACYRVPFPMPDFRPKPPKPPPEGPIKPVLKEPMIEDHYGPLQTPEEILAAQQKVFEVQKQVLDLQREVMVLVDHANRVKAGYQDLSERMKDLAGRIQGLSASSEPVLLSAWRKAKPEQMEGLLHHEVCASELDRTGYIVSARAAYLGETSPVATLTPAGGKGAKSPKSPAGGKK